MKLKYAILYVDDVAATVACYQAAFGLQVRMAHEGGDYAEMETGETVLSFSSRELIRSMGHSPAAPVADRPTFEIAFETDDVAGAVERAVSAGCVLEREPKHMPWGQTVAYVTDPNGFLVELCTSVSQGA